MTAGELSPQHAPSHPRRRKCGISWGPQENGACWGPRTAPLLRPGAPDCLLLRRLHKSYETGDCIGRSAAVASAQRTAHKFRVSVQQARLETRTPQQVTHFRCVTPCSELPWAARRLGLD